ncbi:hypothetical protein CDAR_35591 [Caerostris darwini]|uniref:Uncharacterized protein n=1 Tax=Caerostris darwini TaxID=1538125 RepID=A0AAV4SJZ5_9ARAC|nr:hypothetical protein CDAR_35591 [Caerostris darwini]
MAQLVGLDEGRTAESSSINKCHTHTESQALHRPKLNHTAVGREHYHFRGTCCSMKPNLIATINSRLKNEEPREHFSKTCGPRIISPSAVSTRVTNTRRVGNDMMIERRDDGSRNYRKTLG